MHFVNFLQVVVQVSFSLRLTNDSGNNDIITAIVCTVDGGSSSSTPLFVFCWLLASLVS